MKGSEREGRPGCTEWPHAVIVFFRDDLKPAVSLLKVTLRLLGTWG